MELTLTSVLLVFLGGFILHRHASVRIAAVACLLLGVLISGNDIVHEVVHTLDGAFGLIT